MNLLVERSFQLAEPRLDNLKLVDGADPFVANRGMRRPPGDPQSERERARLGGDEPQAGRFENVRRIRTIATLGHGKAANSAILLTNNALQDQTASKWEAAFLQGGGGADADREPGLHVAGAAAVEASGLDVCRPGGGMPGLAVSHRNDVDMAVEDQRAFALVAEQAGHQYGLGALHLHSGESWMRLQATDVSLETIDLEAGLLQGKGDQVLHRPLLAGHRGDPDQVLRQVKTGVGIECLERPGFNTLPDHRLSLVASGGEVEGAVAVGIANATEEDAVFAMFWLDRRPALRAVPEHDEKVSAVDQLELGDLGGEFCGLRREDPGRHEEALHQFPRGDHANELADVTRLNVSQGESPLLALDDRPLFSLPEQEVSSTVGTVLPNELS